MENSNDMEFTEEEMAVDDLLGYPKAYAKLCRDRGFGPFSNGPHFTYTPYPLSRQEDSRVKAIDDLFPVINPQIKYTSKPKTFINLLWKQLNHLGNAGFDPEMIRVDPFGNVLYYHADAASPLAWDIDHWFPCSRGGLTVPSNLRILQFQVCNLKQNKLEFLIPWWDFQLGVSINQFLSIFASSNSDFRRRAYSWLFYEGESEELHASQTVDFHKFPRHFLEAEKKVGLAPAAIVLTRKDPLDFNRRPRSGTPIVAARKTKHLLKENEDPMWASNPYQAIAMARDSLKQREAAPKMQAEIQKLDHEVGEIHQRSEEEKVSIQELEAILSKKQRRAGKCRLLVESQSSYRIMLEKMIRDSMHQTAVFKEQMKLNQAAASALYARLEAQKALTDSAERGLFEKCKQRDELEKKIIPEVEHSRKRSRAYDTLHQEDVQRLPQTEQNSTVKDEPDTLLHSNEKSEVEEVEAKKETITSKTAVLEEDEKSKRGERGKENIEKWLKFLEEKQEEEAENEVTRSEELIKKRNSKFSHTDIKAAKQHCDNSIEDVEKENETTPHHVETRATKPCLKDPPYRILAEKTNEEVVVSNGGGVRRMSSPDDRMRWNKEAALRRIPSSPSLIHGMKKKVDSLRKNGDAAKTDELSRNSFIGSSFKAMKVIKN